MSAEDGFLSRWARRKAEARQSVPDVAAPTAATEADAPVEGEPFDIASLPSLDGLTATSDITMFMHRAVPETLRNAALRKVWATDPAIRDYIGPADFQWDFHAEGGITGFGALPSGTDIAQMLSDVTDYHLKPAVEARKNEARGDEARGNEARSVLTETTAESAPASAMPAALAGEGAPEAEAAPEGVEETPLAPPQAPLPAFRRRHGRATPR